MRKILLLLSLLISSIAVAQPLPGTVNAKQSGTWTVQPGNTANTTPWLTTLQQGGNTATVSAGGALKVDASASTQPVSGTVAATQSGTWTVQPGNTANTTPWLATISQGGNSAVVSAAGALAGNIAQIAGATAQSGSGTATGALRVELPTNGTGVVGLNAGSNIIGSLTANQSVNVAQVAGATANSGSGTATGALRVELPTNGTGVVGINAGSATIGSIASITTSVVPGTGATNLGKLEDAAAASGDTLVGTMGRINTSLATLAADGDYTTPALDTVGRNFVTGQVASGTTAAGNPVSVGGIADTTEPTAVTDGQAVTSFLSPVGKTVTSPYAIRAQMSSSRQSASSSGDLTLVNADASYRICLTSLALTKDSVVTASTYNVTNGAAGANLWGTRLNASVNTVSSNTFPTAVCTLTTNVALVLNSSAAVDTYVGYTYYKTAE